MRGPQDMWAYTGLGEINVHYLTYIAFKENSNPLINYNLLCYIIQKFSVGITPKCSIAFQARRAGGIWGWGEKKVTMHLKIAASSKVNEQ